jgi:hypothetical protein
MESLDSKNLGKEIATSITKLFTISTTATKKYIDEAVENKREIEEFTPLPLSRKSLNLNFKKKKIYITLRTE